MSQRPMMCFPRMAANVFAEFCDPDLAVVCPDANAMGLHGTFELQPSGVNELLRFFLDFQQVQSTHLLGFQCAKNVEFIPDSSGDVDSFLLPWPT